MRLIIGRVHPQPLWIDPNHMSLGMPNQLPHARFQQLVRRVLRQREYMLGGVFLRLVDATAFDANGIDEEGGEGERHFDLGIRRFGAGSMVATGFLPFGFDFFEFSHDA